MCKINFAHWHFSFKIGRVTQTASSSRQTNSHTMKITDCYKVGLVMKPHGLKGEVTVSLDANAPNDLAGLDAIFIKLNDQLVPYFITSVSMKGNKAFVKFDDVNTVDDASKISKHEMYLPKAARPKTGRGEFYDDEITGFNVEDEKEGPLGPVTEVVQAGANRLLSVRFGDKDLLIPINAPFIKSVNKTKKVVRVELPDGYLDL